MKIDIITIFPDQVEHYLTYGIYRIAQKKKLIEIQVHDLRKWTDDSHKTVDDRPYGGGAGMVLMVEPIYKAIKELRKENSIVIAPTPQGIKLSQQVLHGLTDKAEDNTHYIFLSGHYEGFDQRILDNLVNMEISLGDYILSGGELPSLVIIDGMLRLIPGVLGNEESNKEESFSEDSLEYPHYTRPEDFMGWKVPDILLSGNHKEIALWREEQAKANTLKKRPDIVK